MYVLVRRRWKVVVELDIQFRYHVPFSLLRSMVDICKLHDKLLLPLYNKTFDSTTSFAEGFVASVTRRE